MKMEEFRAKLGRLKAGQEPFTLVLDDPAGNSYLQVNSETEICYRGCGHLAFVSFLADKLHLVEL